MKLYVAGGAVRDLLSGGCARDVDYAFDAPEEEFIQRNPSARKLQSGNYPIYLLNGAEYSRLAEGGPREDLLRRDVTLNAFLLEENGILHSLPDSLRHLRDGVLHPASESALRDDPLRVFRGARLCAVLEKCAPSEE